MGLFGDLRKTYELQRSYEGSSSLEKSVHMLLRMDEVLKKLIHDSEYNVRWLAAEDWEKTPSEVNSYYSDSMYNNIVLQAFHDAKECTGCVNADATYGLLLSTVPTVR